MLPLMRAIGQMTGKPTGLEKFDDGTFDAMAEFGAAIDGASIIIGDLPDDSRFAVQEPSGVTVVGIARVVGKVVTTGQWKPLPGIPIYSQLPREARCELERKGPPKGSEMMWLQGPAMQLSSLAIYQ
ncbi:hypothetical protein [Microbacterium aurum]